MEQVFASQNGIGRLADECIYRADVAYRLSKVHLSSQQEVVIHLSHKTFAKTLYLDLVVDGQAVYELKTAITLSNSHVAQLLTYLYLLDLKHGKLVNFRNNKVKTQFVNAPVPRTDRRSFSVETRSFRGSDFLMQLCVDLIRDWGTCLSISLYQEAIDSLLDGDDVGLRMLPLTRGSKLLGNQRFHLVNHEEALQLTAFTKSEQDYEQQLKRLLEISPLRAIHRINIAPHCVSFTTISKNGRIESGQ